MNIFNRKNSTKARIQALEEHLGIVWADDGYLGKEYIDRDYGVLKVLRGRIEKLEDKKGKK